METYVRNKVLSTVLLRLIVVPVCDLAAMLGDRFLQRGLGGVPVVA